MATTTTSSSHQITFQPNNPLASLIARPKSPKSKPMTHMLSQDFKRRKDWHKRLVEDVMDVLQVIGPTGELLFVSESMARLTGFPTSELLGNQISNWCFEEEDRLNLEREIKHCFSPGSSGIINFYCRFKKKDSPGCMIFEISGHLINVKTNPGVLRGETKSEKQVIIINARPYPTSCGRLTDEFLELMLENEAMMRVMNSRVGVGTMRGDEGVESSSSGQALERANGATTTTTMTGKNEAENQGEGKKKNNNNNKNEEPDEAAEDDGQHLAKESELEDELHLPFPAPPPPPPLPPVDPSEPAPRPRARGPNKRDRADFLCLDCGVTQSPEWRKGPMGRKTLCNACGLRYAKKAK
ncbi:hypothetical protein, variant [Puccinia triticina 1-1 BBBD Race 1]|nr:hypothetical protein, variant [Puccinia triticina 1-1 BBBD Race 1]